MASKTFYDCGCMEQGDQTFYCDRHTPDPALLPVAEAPPQDDIDLVPIKAREAAASTGRWRVRQPTDGGCRSLETGPEGFNRQFIACFCTAGNADREFITHARTDIPALVAEIERLRAASCATRTDEAWDVVRRWRANGGRMILLKYAANELEAALTEPPIPAEKAPTR